MVSVDVKHHVLVCFSAVADFSDTVFVSLLRTAAVERASCGGHKLLRHWLGPLLFSIYCSDRTWRSLQSVGQSAWTLQSVGQSAWTSYSSIGTQHPLHPSLISHNYVASVDVKQRDRKKWKVKRAEERSEEGSRAGLLQWAGLSFASGFNSWSLRTLSLWLFRTAVERPNCRVHKLLRTGGVPTSLTLLFWRWMTVSSVFAFAGRSTESEKSKRSAALAQRQDARLVSRRASVRSWASIGCPFSSKVVVYGSLFNYDFASVR